MGIFLSTLCNPTSYGGIKTLKHHVSSPGSNASNVAAKTENEPLAQAIYETLKDAQGRGWLQVVQDRHHVLCIDDDFRMERSTKDAIRIFACFLLLIYRAFDADATLFFTSHRNTEEKSLPQDLHNKAAYLDNLFSCKDWYSAMRLAESSLEDQDLGVWKWMKATAGHADTQEERFERFLAHIREQKIPHWTGWPTRNLECDSFLSLYETALAKSKQQPKPRGNLSLITKLAICKASRTLQWEKVVKPISFVILTGSYLQESELDSIKTNIKQIKDTGKEFSFEVVPFVKAKNDPSLQSHRQLRDFNSSKKNVYNYTSIIEPLFLEKGPSALLLAKILDSHKRVRENDKYGSKTLRIGDDKLRPPSLQEVEMALGLVTDM